MSVNDPRNTQSESFSYIGRDSHGSVHVALGVVVVGLILGIVAGPSGSGHAELNQIVTDAGQPAGESVVQTAPALVEPPALILASVNPEDRPADAPVEREPKQHNLKVRSGDTLMSIMLAAGIDRSEAHEAVTALRKVFDPKDLRVGQHVRLTVSPDDALTEMMLDPSVLRRVSVRRDPGAEFRVYETEKTLTREMSLTEGRIRSSLYTAALRNGMPMAVLSELIRVYSWDVDFQREIQEGDRFEAAFERFVDEDGRVVRYGNVIYATLTLSGTEKPLYRFESAPGIVEYYDDQGRSAKRPLMRTPIDGARLSSGFGKRRHPVLGYTKMHRGVDFAAPPGTPIYAAGDGVVVFRGRKGGYGNFVQIRHAGKYPPAYAHMKGFKSGLSVGSRVRQGQVIGYVGSTGRSTGPHLHYEIRVSGKQVNPLTVKMPSGRKLDKKSFARFQTKRHNIDTLVAGLRKETTLSRR